MLDTVFKKLSRGLVMTACFWLPEERKRALERWLRGRDETRKLRRADIVVASFGKSGRTWLRVMLSHVYALTHDASESELLSLRGISRRRAGLPRIFFTHDNYIKDYTGNTDSKVDFYDHRVILLVRDPRDVTVSQYFQWKHRMKSRKTRVNDYPPKGTEISLYDFLMSPAFGLVRGVDFLNVWAGEIHRMPHLLVVRYEDLRREPAKILAEIVEFIGTPVSQEVIEEAVDYASVDRMREREAANSSWLSGGRLKPADPGNADSYKVRRAKVGGYRDYFSDEEVARLDAWIDAHLRPGFGYTSSERSGIDSGADARTRAPV